MILDLVEVGLLAAERNPSEGYPRWTFSKLSLISCVEQILRYIETYPGEDKRAASLVDLIAASRSLSVVGMNAASVLARVAEGNLHAYYPANRDLELRSLQFNYDDIQKSANAIKSENEWIRRAQFIPPSQTNESTWARRVP